MAMKELRPEFFAKLPALVVEDNKFMRGIVADLLRQIGFEQIHFAGDGKEGIAQFRTWMPRVVFTDWNMPVMDGVELTRWIRQSDDSHNAETPVIMITGNNQQQEILRARDAGVTEFVAKPVTTKAIVRRLHSAVLAPRKFVRSPNYIGPCRRRRQNVDYAGPLRRIDDPLASDKAATTPQAQIYRALEADLAGLNELAKALDVTDRHQVREVRNRTDKARDMAKDAEDAPLSCAADSLMGYIDACGAGGSLDREIVFMHLSAMSRLMEIHDQYDDVRDKVVEGLKKVVRKRLNPSRASA